MHKRAAGATGREVACRSFGRLLVEWERAGLNRAALVEGSGCSAEQLFDKRERISWASYRAIMVNARQLWDDEGFYQLGLVILDTPWAKHITIPLRLLATPLDAYRWMTTPRTGMAGQTFTCIEHRLRQLAPGRLVMNSTMREGYPPCREYFLVTRGALASLPRLFGLPPAEVEMRPTATGATYDIRHPVRGTALAWLRRTLAGPFTARAAAREIEEAHIELHQRNQELEINNRELELRNAELERYAYTVSHDLKAPLVTIKGFLGALEKDSLAGDHDRVRGDLAQIHRAADRMRRLMSELLDLSRIGRVSRPMERVSLGGVAREAVEQLAGRLEEDGVEVEIQAEMPWVRGDRVRLLEVYQNLVENAARFMGEQTSPRIEIGAGEVEREVLCRVADNGIGIEPRFHQHVFGLFNRLDPEDEEGTGVGLALVKRILEAHGGRIWIESAGAGHGTTFWFTLPRRAETKADAREG